MANLPKKKEMDSDAGKNESSDKEEKEPPPLKKIQRKRLKNVVGGLVIAVSQADFHATLSMSEVQRVLEENGYLLSLENVLLAVSNKTAISCVSWL